MLFGLFSEPMPEAEVFTLTARISVKLRFQNFKRVDVVAGEVTCGAWPTTGSSLFLRASRDALIEVLCQSN